MGNRNLAIFDFDGTIADSAAWFGNALNELARHNGFREVSAEQREMLRGRSTREIFAYLGIPSWKLPLVVRQLREIAARDVEQISIFPWVPDVLAALRSRGISIAIVSSNTRANIRRVLGTEVASMIDQFGTGQGDSFSGRARAGGDGGGRDPGAAARTLQRRRVQS